MIDDSRYSGDAITPGRTAGALPGQLRRPPRPGRFPVTLLPGRDVTSVRARCRTAACRLRCTTSTDAGGARRTPSRGARPDGSTCRRRSTTTCGSGSSSTTTAQLLVEPDYSVRWKGMNGHRIYTFNASRYSHGLTNAGPHPAAGPGRDRAQLHVRPGDLPRSRDDLCAVQLAEPAATDETARRPGRIVDGRLVRPGRVETRRAELRRTGRYHQRRTTLVLGRLRTARRCASRSGRWARCRPDGVASTPPTACVTRPASWSAGDCQSVARVRCSGRRSGSRLTSSGGAGSTASEPGCRLHRSEIATEPRETS